MNDLKIYNRYKYMIENIKDIIWELDTNLVFTFVSPTSRETTGYEADYLVGKCMLNFLTEKSKRTIIDHLNQNQPQRINGDMLETVLYDVEFICHDGNIIWFEVSVKPVFEQKRLRGYIGTSRDISAKKQYELKLGRDIEELKSANERFEEQATLDMLTGVYNRRKFEYYINLALEKMKEYRNTFSIIMFDIDNFKQVNDYYGHKKGDQILQEITVIVKHKLRETDKLFRWGGDEFIILLPETPSENALKVAEKVRNSIESYNWDVQSEKVTVSIGVGDYKNGENLEQFISRIDKALLRSKMTGRNKIEFCE